MDAGLYKHYKGGVYQVLGVAEHSETGERLVVYVSLSPDHSGPALRCRPEPMFHDLVEVGTGLSAPRFEYIGDNR